MSGDGDKRGGHADPRSKRLAEELRANLAKRKAQARARAPDVDANGLEVEAEVAHDSGRTGPRTDGTGPD
jgi:hypothetical protein